ncbi:MAG: class I SAM-dependent methyltransferase [Gammaproteobacteria bacterium]|nr:class I SAM-dependent methyltransferase [Gammaproteobacteria bacterium]
MRLISLALLCLLLSACGNQTTTTSATDTATSGEASVATVDKLGAVLAAQPAQAQARYAYRNPKQTLEFFGIKPGMTVVEVLPGAGWYTKILLPYLGDTGHVLGLNYATSLWPNFSFANDEYLARMATWTDTWPAEAQAWRDADSATVSAAVFGAIPADQRGSADAVLFFRALHNMARFDSEPFLKNAIQDAYELLKPGGIAGIVQHEARADASDAWADGSAGYLKRDFVISQMEAAGFTFLGASDVNQNLADQPTSDEVVWRLPPSLSGAKDNPEQKAAMLAVGESNRMTLKFAKPAQ